MLRRLRFFDRYRAMRERKAAKRFRVPNRVVWPSPRSMKPEDAEEAWRFAEQLADGVCLPGPIHWAQVAKQTNPTYVTLYYHANKARESGLSIFLQVDPWGHNVRDGVLRGIPAGWSPAFGDPRVFQACIDECVARVSIAHDSKSPVTHLVFGMEILDYRRQRYHDWLNYLAVLKDVRHAVRRASPTTKVGFSVQWDRLHEFDLPIDERTGTRFDEEIKGVSEAFETGEADFVGISSYPGALVSQDGPPFATPHHIPVDYYSKLRRYVPAGKEVIFAELAYPAINIAHQNAFMARFPMLAKRLKPTLVNWNILVDTIGFHQSVAMSGLVSNDHVVRPAGYTFKLWKG